MATIVNTIRWADNTEQLRRNLEQGLNQIEAMTKSADKLARSYGGDNLIRAAHTHAAAIEKLGGVTKLTNAEKEKLNNLVSRALEKYQALGRSAPTALIELEKATRKTLDPTERLRASLESTSRNMTEVGGQMSNLGSRLTFTVTAPIVGMATAVVKAGIDFESSFAGVRKTVDATESEFRVLSDGFRQMSREIPISVNELNKIGESAGQLGIKTENILGFTRVMADLGVTTNLSSDQAATALARLANITGMPQTEFSRLGSTIVALGNTFATTESEIVEFGTRIAGAGSIAGLTEAQIMAIGAAMSSVGVEAEAGGTAVQKVLLSMSTAVAGGGDKLRVFAQAAGMTAQQFATAFRDDAGAAFAAFTSGIGRQGIAATATLEKLELTDQRLVKAFLSLGGAGDLLTRSLALGTKAWSENTALAKEAEQRYSTTASQLTIFWNKVKDVAISLSVSLLPALTAILGKAEPFLQWVAHAVAAFASLPAPIQMVGLAIPVLVAAVGPLLVVLGSMVSGAGLMVKGLSAFIGVAPQAAAGFSTIGSAATLARAAVLGVQGAIAALSVMAIAKFVSEASGLLRDQEQWRAQVLDDNARIAKALSIASKIAGREIVDLAEAARIVNDENVRLRGGTEQLTLNMANFGNALDKGQSSLDNLARSQRSMGAASAASASDTSKFTKEVRSLAETFSGAELAVEVKKASEAIGLLTDAKRNDPVVIGRIVAHASELSSQGAILTGALREVWLAQEAWAAGMPRVEIGLGSILKRTKDVTKELGKMAVIPGPLPIASNPLDVLKTIHAVAPSVQLSEPPPALSSLSDFFRDDLAGTILGAFQGGGNVLNSIGASVGGFLGSAGSTVGNAVGGFLTKNLGKTLGGALGSVLPGLGTLLGGSLGSLLGGIFGKSKNAILDEQATAQIKKLQADLLKTHGSMANISRMGKIIGVDLESAWGSRSQQGLKDFTALMEEFEEKQARLQGALDRYGLTWMDLGDQARAAHLDQVADDLLADFQILQTAGADVTRIVGGMSGAINEFLRNALTTGAQIPPSMQPMIEQLIRTGQLTEENAALMLGLQHEAAPAWADITAAAERYGIAVDKLGPKITQIRINEEAAQIVKDFDLLVGAGANVGAVMAGMQQKVQGLVSDALRLGLELPASMRPMLDQMVKAGLLTDDTGKKLTSLSGLKFAEPLSAAVDRLIDKLEELIGAIQGGVGAAIRDINGRTFTIHGKVDWDNVQTGGRPPALHTGGYAALSGIQKHHQGTARILKFHTGVASLASDEVPAILQVGESVLNRRATQAIGPEAIRALNQGRMGAPATTRVEVRTDALEREVSALRQDVRDQADRTYRAIRDAFQQGAA